MKTQILFFIIMIYGLLHNAWAQTYSMADSIALEAIDMACDTSDNLNWNTESDPGMWEGVIWNSENPKRVATLNIYDKLLTGEMDLTALTGLTALSCYNNQLTSLDVSNLGNLVNLSCFNNQLNTLDISAVYNLAYFTCSMNQLTELPLTGLTNLTYLSCGINQLSSLDVSDLVNLNYLSCNVNNIELLDVSNLPDLTELYCQANQMKELHVSPLANFSYLFCYENRLPFSSLVTCLNTANLTYSPQYNIFEPVNLSKDTLIDYSSEALIDTSATNFFFFKNGVEVETNTTGLYYTTGSGEYSCSMTNAVFPDLTLVTEQITVAIPTRIIDEKSIRFDFFPNPAKDRIILNSTDQIIEISIFSLEGKELIHACNPVQEMDVSGLAKGIYLLKIVLGQKSVNSKLIIE